MEHYNYATFERKLKNYRNEENANVTGVMMTAQKYLNKNDVITFYLISNFINICP